MITQLFAKAEASVDNAIGDFFGRLLIAMSFIVAVGFAAASLSSIVNRVYGSEIGNLILAAGFVVLGCAIAVVVKMRNHSLPHSAASAEQAVPVSEPETKSMFDDEALMAVVTSAAPIVLPSLLRTAMKNWHILLAAAAGLYVVSQTAAAPAVQPAE